MYDSEPMMHTGYIFYKTAERLITNVVDQTLNFRIQSRHGRSDFVPIQGLKLRTDHNGICGAKLAAKSRLRAAGIQLFCCATTLLRNRDNENEKNRASRVVTPKLYFYATGLALL